MTFLPLLSVNVIVWPLIIIFVFLKLINFKGVPVSFPIKLINAFIFLASSVLLISIIF